MQCSLLFHNVINCSGGFAVSQGQILLGEFLRRRVSIRVQSYSFYLIYKHFWCEKYYQIVKKVYQLNDLFDKWQHLSAITNTIQDK